VVEAETHWREHTKAFLKKEECFFVNGYFCEGAGVFPGKAREAAREEKMREEKETKENPEKLPDKVAVRHPETDRELE